MKFLLIASIFAVVTLAIALPAPEKNESANLEKGKSNVIGELTSEDYRQFQFSNEAMFSRQQQQPQTKGPCGWASSAPACSNACYLLGWPYYTYWYASGTCCCS